MSAIPQHEVDDWKRLTSMIDNLQNDRISDKHHAQERKVHDVTLKLSGDEETLKKLEKKAKKEAKDVKSISKPGFKRFGARIGGHLDEKTEKEKKEAVAAQNAVEKKQEEIQREKKELEQLTQALQHLSVQAGSLKTAEKDRKNLIKQVFEGPVGDDMENKLEYDATRLKPAYKQAEREAKDMQKAEGLMNEAVKNSAQCVQCMRAAEAAQRVDMVSNLGRRNGGLMGDMVNIRKQQDIKGAQAALKAASAMVDRARDFCPQIQSINPDVIESLSGIVDVLFDNVFTDAIAGKKIKASMERIVRQHKYLTEGLSWVHSRANELNVKYSAKKQKYKSVKSQLVNHRNALMKQAASGQQNWLAPNARQAQPQQNLTPQQYGQYPAAPPSPRPDQAEAFDIMAPVVGVPQLDPNNPFGSIDQIPEAPPMDGNNPYGYAPPPGQFGGYAPAPGIYGQAPPPPEQYGQAPPYQGQYAQAPPQYGATQGYAPQEHYQQQPPPPADQETPEKKPIAPEGYPQ